MRYIIFIFPLVMLLNSTYAQETNEADIAALIESRNFEFHAKSANPLRGRTIFLSPGYTFTVSGDSLISYLPYYGRAYQANIDPSEAGIKFTSTDFEYNVKQKKKRWDISIRPKDATPSPQILLSVSAGGRASLRLTMIDRQSISFDGQIRKIGEK